MMEASCRSRYVEISRIADVHFLKYFDIGSDIFIEIRRQLPDEKFKYL